MSKVERKKLAIIAGGAGFIGKEIASMLGRAHWRVVTLSRRGGGEYDVACDITDEKAVRDAVRSVTEKYGTIDSCIHSAALKVDPKDTSRMQTSVALSGARNLAAAALPHMGEGAAFIAITSKLIEPGINPIPTGDYVPSKIALREYLRELAKSAAGNIRVYAVAPGFIAGGLNEGVPPKFLEMFAKKTGAGMATVSDVAKLVTTLCTLRDAFPPASSITVPEEEVSAL